jgi:hypothetical protein
MANVEGMLDIAGVHNPKAGPEKQNSQYYDFGHKMSDWIDSFQAEHKRPPTPVEEKAQAGDLLKQVTMPGKVFGTNQVQAFKLKPNEEATAQMPKEQIPEYQARFQQQYGRAPFPGELDQLYFTYLLHPGDKNALASIDAKIRENSKNPARYATTPTSTPQATPAVAKTPGQAEMPQAGETPAPAPLPPVQGDYGQVDLNHEVLHGGFITRASRLLQESIDKRKADIEANVKAQPKMEPSAVPTGPIAQ